MNKLFAVLSLLLVMDASYANQATSSDFDNEDELFETIAGGEEEFEFIRYSPEYIQMSINEDMKVACDRGMCTLFSIANSGDEFKIQFEVGEGNNNDSDGDIVIIPSGSDYTTESTAPYIGLTVSYTYSRCRQDIKVPRSLYIAMNTYMYNLMTEEGTTRRAFTPADEAMIIFYSTIIKQANGCK